MKLNEKKNEILSAISALNKLLVNNESKKADIDKALENIQSEIKAYNAERTRLTFVGLAQTDEPVKNAIIQLNFDIIKLKTNKDKDTDKVSYELVNAKKQIELLEFSKYLGKASFADENWKYKVEKFNQLITFKAVKDLNGDMNTIAKSFYISKLAESVDLGKTPTSNTQVLKQLQTVVDAIIHENKSENDDTNKFKVLSHDVAYIVKLMCKRADSGKIVMPKVSSMHTLVMDVLHRIVCDLDYKIEYSKKKEDETAQVEVENEIETAQEEPKAVDENAEEKTAKPKAK